MTDRLIELLTLTSTQLLDIDAEGRLLLASDRTGSQQLYELDLPAASEAEAEPRLLADFGQPATGRYLPGGFGGQRAVVISVDDSGTERTQLMFLPLDARAELTAQPEQLVTDPAFIHTLHDVLPNRVIYSTNRRNGVDFDIVLRVVSSGADRVLYDGGGWFHEVAVSADGRWIAACRLTLLPASSQVLLIDTRSGVVTELTDAQVPGDWSGLRWLPDSTGVLASSDAGAQFQSVRRYDLAAAAWRIMLAEDGANLSAWPSPDGVSWAVVRSQDGADEVHLQPVADNEPVGRALLLTLPDVGVVANRTPLVFAPDSQSFGMTYSSPTDPPEVYLWTQTHGLHRRTESNPLTSTLDLPQAGTHLVPAADGESIPVFTLTPAEPNGAAVIIVHGGPEAAAVRSWSPVAAALALAGFLVVIPNVRGSAGYGRRWLSLDDVHLRLDSVTDLVSIAEWLPALAADPARVALYGGSYGGYMVLAGLTFHPERWAAGVDIVGMSSLVTFLENTSPYRRAYREREYGSLAEHRQVLHDASPLPRIAALRAPLFIIHGANDPRVPLSEAEQVAAAVRANGAPCELLIYPDEGHGLAKRANRLDAYPQVFTFLDQHLSP